MIKGKVTAAALRKIPIDGSETFEVPDAASIECGKTITYRMQHVLRCKFSVVSDYAKNRITITRSTRP